MNRPLIELDKVLSYVDSFGVGGCLVSDVSKKFGVSRVTAWRYLMDLQSLDWIIVFQEQSSKKSIRNRVVTLEQYVVNTDKWIPENLENRAYEFAKTKDQADKIHLRIMRQNVLFGGEK